MFRKTVLSAAIAVMASFALVQPATANDASAKAALQHYEDCHWSIAFDLLARLADAGDGVAARITALMVRFGPTLYGQRFAASSEQLERWRRIAVVAQDDGV